MLTLKQLTKTFSPGTPNQKLALNRFSLSLKAGEFVTIIGSNGAGKSTLFNAICGSFPLDSGKIILDGEDITNQKEYVRAKTIGRLFQDPMQGTAPSLTIEENLTLAYMSSKKGQKKPSAAYLKEKLSSLEMGLEERMKTKVGTLSGGQRQALTLLMATIAEPKLLLLDEHTAALDPATAEKVLAATVRATAGKQTATLMITHNIPSALALGTRTIMMHEGALVLDMDGEERKNMKPENLLALFREKLSDRMLFSE